MQQQSATVPIAVSSTCKQFCSGRLGSVVATQLGKSSAESIKRTSMSCAGGSQTSDTEFRAAAAELGTEEDAFTAQTSSNSGQSARKQPLLSDLSVDEADLEDFYTTALPANASASSTAADKASSTTGTLPTAGARQTATQAGDSASAHVTGTNSSTDAVVAAALANPKGSASKAATAASQRAAEEEQEEAEWRVRQQATAGSSRTGLRLCGHSQPTVLQLMSFL